MTRDIESAYLATGPREGQKAFTLQTIPANPQAPRRDVAEASGFSLHVGTICAQSGLAGANTP